jgi:hypothetical protein
MSINRANLNRAMNYNGISSGNLEVHYDFDQKSGELIYNKVYPTGFHFVSGDTTKFFSYAYPGLSIGGNDFPVDTNNVSGYFDSASLLQVGIKNDFNYEIYSNGIIGSTYILSGEEDRQLISDYTVFMNLRMSGENYGSGKTKVLWSTMRGENSPSGGYTIGFTDTKDLCVEWITKTGLSSSSYKTRRKVFPVQKLSNYSIISFEKRSNESDSINSSFINEVFPENFLKPSIKINLHDVARDKMVSSTVDLENIAHPPENDKLIEKWYIGNVPFASDNYTGYSGYMDDFILINGANNSLDFLKLVADQYFVTGDYLPPRRELTEVIEYHSDSYQSGASGLSAALEYNPLGYSLSETVDGASVYDPSSPWSGTKEEVTISTTSNLPSASGYTGWQWTDLPEQKTFNSLERLYTNRSLTLYDKSNANDIYELYINTGLINLNYNLSATYLKATNKFTLKPDYTGDPINVFANGLVQFKNSEYQQPTNPSWERTIDFSGTFNENDIVIYDEQKLNAFYSGFTGNTQMELISSDFTGKDVYFHGEKLISGIDYSGTTDRLFINVQDFLTTGYLYFVDARKEISHFTGIGSDLANLDEALIDEQLWLNGVRQIQGVNYSLINNTDILNTGFRLEPQTFKIYNNNETYLNYS